MTALVRHIRRVGAARLAIGATQATAILIGLWLFFWVAAATAEAFGISVR